MESSTALSVPRPIYPPRVQLCLTTALLSAVAVSALLLGCGGEERLDESELPDRLADALPRLEAAGYEVDAVAAGPDDIPILIVKDGDAAVVLAVGRGLGRPGQTGVPLAVRDVSGETFPANGQTLCGPDEYIANTLDAAGKTISRVIRISRFCSAGS
jgi:hypothetical protein